MATARRPLRVPVSVAAERGVSWLNDTAAERRVLLTRFGKPGAVVDSAERLDETLLRLEDARREVVEHFAELASGRSTRLDLDAVCSKVGVDPERVRRRAAELRG